MKVDKAIVFDVLSVFKKIIRIVRREGLIGLIKRTFRPSYIYENNLDGPKINNPKVKNFVLKIVSTEEQIDELIAVGFDFSFYFHNNLRPVKGYISKGLALFCIFIKRELACMSWVVMSDEGRWYHPLPMDYQNEAWIGDGVTNPKYRGLGLYSYLLSKIYEFLKEKGKSRARHITRKNNIASQKAQAKSGSKICGEGIYLKLVLWEIWRVYNRSK